jgi:peroxiredoxin
VRWVGINPNDWSRYPDDSPEAMKKQAKEQGFEFPYLYDESQSVARAYDAVCTPDFYVYGNEGGRFVLRYRGRLDDNWKEEGGVTRREMAEALDALLAGKPIAREQNSSMGCSIKWK